MIATEFSDQDCTLGVNLEILYRFDGVFQRLRAMYFEDPATMEPAVLAFCKHGEALGTQAAVQSALHTFGVYFGVSATLAGCRKSVVGLKYIGVQPTAIARCKVAIGGRRRVHLGRPIKASRASEHGYSVRRRDILKRHAWPPRRAPQNLSAAVSNVEPLGKTHSAK